MKNIFICTLIISCMLYAGDNNINFNSKLFDIKTIKDEKIKNYLIGLEKFNPFQASILKDYYEAVTCKKDFYNSISLEELSSFVLSEDYSDLINATTKDGLYEEVIEQISFFYCTKK